MKVLAWLSLYFCLAHVCSATVVPDVYLYDSNTPLELADPNIPFVYCDIMVGTMLTIVVSSDSGGYWSGSLVVTGNDMSRGVLSGRDCNPNTCDWKGSRTETAGFGARVLAWDEEDIQGFDLYGHSSAVPGEWFIIDYTATDLGICHVNLYDHSVSLTDSVYRLRFSHVRTRDFDHDTEIGFADLAMLAANWQNASCGPPGWCSGTDLDVNGCVDFQDLILFAQYWLERTE
jgi:hypothetical protein